MKNKDKIKNIFSDKKKLKIKHKEFVCNIWDGTKIYLVDGEEIRDNGNVEYCLGGHYYEQVGDSPTPTDCPKDEIWIEKDLNPKEQVFILVHELTEYIQMKYHGMKYEKAHDISNSLENAVRQMAKKAKMVPNN